MAASVPAPQTATARRAAEAQLRAFIDTIAPTQQRRTAALRKALRQRLPTACEIVYAYADSVVISYAANERGYEGVLSVRVSADEIKLYFNPGKGLPDPEKLLQGSAKLVRWIPLESAATLTRPAVAALIDAAIARSPTPFAKTGEGPVIIRSKTAR